MGEKEPRSFSIDPDVKEELQHREDINASAVVNSYLREFLSATDRTEEEVIIAEIDKQIDDIEEDIAELQEKRERLVNRKDRIRNRADEEASDELEGVLDDAANTPADPSHPYVVDHADAVDMTPEELAREIADYHDKEYDPFNDDTPESLK